MADLANLGKDLTDQNKNKAAEQNFEMALQMGEDSAAFHAMGSIKSLGYCQKDRRLTLKGSLK